MEQLKAKAYDLFCEMQKAIILSKKLEKDLSDVENQIVELSKEKESEVKAEVKAKKSK